MRFLWILTILTLTSSGCTSFKTTVMQRCNNGAFFPDVVAKTKGVPVKLKVPTHVQVTVVEDYFIEKDDSNKKLHEIPIELDGQRIRSMTVQTEVIYTDKVFTVDFKRPAGGIFTLGGADNPVNFDTEQYFSQVQATYTEQTLSDINTALGTLKPSLTKAKKTSVTVGSSNNLATETREVARARFDISDSCWESQLNEFVGTHVTCCYQDCHYQN